MNTTTSFRAPSHLRKRSVGFTLVELVAVLAIAAILAGTAIPSLRGLLRSTALTSATNDFYAALMLTRSEAVLRGQRVVMCKSSDGASCATTGGWEQGWLVFADGNNNALHEPGERVLMRTQALTPQLHLTGNLNVAKYISYDGNGLTKLPGGGFQAGTLTFCNASATATEARQVVLSSSGRPRVQKTRVPSCA